jgi:hypothetical protein
MTRINRRHFMTCMSTAAGAALLSPFFAQLGRAGGAPTPRFVFFVEGNGFEPVTVLSPGARAQIDATLASPIGTARHWSKRYRHTAMALEATGDLSDAVALRDIGDVANKTAVVLGLSSKITGGGHSAWHGVLSSRRTANRMPTGITIDAHLSTLPSVQGAVFDALRVGYCSHQHHPGKNLDFGTCATAAGVAAPLVLQPGAAFDTLFSPTTNPAQFGRDGHILDFALEDVRRALSPAVFGANSTERRKLEDYLGAIEANINRRSRLGDALGLPTMPTLPTRFAAARRSEDFYAVLDAHISTVSVALQGGLTNVAVVGLGTGADFDTFYDSTHVGRHTSHHESELSDGPRDYIHAQNRTKFNRMFGLARVLDAVPEGNGTLLDHTVLVYIGDNGETHHAEADEFPVVIIGGGAFGLQTGGRTLVYPGQSAFTNGHRQVSNLWNTLGHIAGQPLQDFGGESLGAGTRAAEGRLVELLP